LGRLNRISLRAAAGIPVGDFGGRGTPSSRRRSAARSPAVLVALVSVSLAALSLAACDSARAPAGPCAPLPRQLAAADGAATREPAAPSAAASSADGKAPAAAGRQNLAMGTGEPRAPEVFTRERRLLDAVQRGDRATIERAL